VSLCRRRRSESDRYNWPRIDNHEGAAVWISPQAVTDSIAVQCRSPRPPHSAKFNSPWDHPGAVRSVGAQEAGCRGIVAPVHSSFRRQLDFNRAMKREIARSAPLL
jgi:hypothetical protein